MASDGDSGAAASRLAAAAIPAAGGWIAAELRATIALAAPLAAANLAFMAMGFTNMVMVGRLGGGPLAAAGLGASIYFTIVILTQGILSAVAPLAAHAIGAGDRPSAGQIVSEGLLLAGLLSLPAIAVLLAARHLLVAIGYDPALADLIGRYLAVIACGMPASLGFAALRSFLVATSHGRTVMLAVMLCIPVNLALNWILIFGHLGVPNLGIVGSGMASSISIWLIAIGLAGRLFVGRDFAAYRISLAALLRRSGQIGRILRLGLPIGGILALETGLFVTTGILMGVLGAAALGAHQLLMNCVSIIFMVPLGIGQATTARVAVALGAGSPAAARRAGFTALALGAGFMLAMGVVLWTAPLALVGVYLDVNDPGNREVIAVALRLFAIAALLQVFDGSQVIAASALRGYRDTAVPLLLATLGYWGAGFSLGWVLAFPLGLGAVGLWWGLVTGVATVAVLLTARLHVRSRRAAITP